MHSPRSSHRPSSVHVAHREKNNRVFVCVCVCVVGRVVCRLIVAFGACESVYSGGRWGGLGVMGGGVCCHWRYHCCRCCRA